MAQRLKHTFSETTIHFLTKSLEQCPSPSLLNGHATFFTHPFVSSHDWTSFRYTLSENCFAQINLFLKFFFQNIFVVWFWNDWANKFQKTCFYTSRTIQYVFLHFLQKNGIFKAINLFKVTHLSFLHVNILLQCIT